jgi:hypothetical protein
LHLDLPRNAMSIGTVHLRFSVQYFNEQEGSIQVKIDIGGKQNHYNIMFVSKALSVHLFASLRKIEVSDFHSRMIRFFSDVCPYIFFQFIGLSMFPGYDLPQTNC